MVRKYFNGTIEYVPDFDQFDDQNDTKYSALSEQIEVGEDIDSENCEMLKSDDDWDSENILTNKQKETIKPNLKNSIDEPEIKHTTEMNMIRNSGKIMKGRKMYFCKECGFSARKSDVKRHVESKHMGIRYSYDKCDVKFTSISQLNTHEKIKHEGVRYQCNYCEKLMSTTGSLNVHVKSLHEGAEYLCTQCTYKTSRISKLKKHTEVVHEGVRYSCVLCTYKAKTNFKLKRHINPNMKAPNLNVKSVSINVVYQNT